MEKSNTRDALIHGFRTLVYVAVLVFTYVFPANWLTPAVLFVTAIVLVATLVLKVFVEKNAVTLERALAILEMLVMPIILVGHIEVIFNFPMGSWVLAFVLLNVTMFITDCVEANKN